MKPSRRLNHLRKQIDIVHKSPIGRRAQLLIGSFKESGVKIGVMIRPSEHIYRGRFATMTAAAKDGVLSWMIDATMPLYLMDTYGVEFMLVIEKDTGDIWVSRLEHWVDESKLFRDHHIANASTDHRGASLNYLPVKHMLHLPGSPDLAPRRRA